MGNGDTLDSTEVLTSQDSRWVYANPLPRKVMGLRGLVLGGVLYMTGGQDRHHDNTNDVLAWENDKWVFVGSMWKGRSWHAVTTIRMNEDIMQFCENPE